MIPLMTSEKAVVEVLSYTAKLHSSGFAGLTGDKRSFSEGMLHGACCTGYTPDMFIVLVV